MEGEMSVEFVPPNTFLKQNVGAPDAVGLYVRVRALVVVDPVKVTVVPSEQVTTGV